MGARSRCLRGADLNLLCVDVGSTFTKASLVRAADGELIGYRAHPTTSSSDVLLGIQRARQELLDIGHEVPEVSDQHRVAVCSSAGGGLRLAVVGYERQVTAQAGHRVGLSAGATVVGVFAGKLKEADVAALRSVKPDVILLVGGTNSGNAEVLLHNARRLAQSRVGAAIVLAGNDAAAPEAAQALTSTKRRFLMAANVLPRIGVVDPVSARDAIRAMFLTHVIGGKGLSRGPLFASLVRAPTPDAVLTGAQTLGAIIGEDLIVADVGGATTDVYSVLQPQGEDATLRKHVVATLWHSRTVEGDLGMRWSAATVLEAARLEGLPGADSPGLTAWAATLRDNVSRIPTTPTERAWDVELARMALVLAVRRHGRPVAPSEGPRALGNVKYLLGSGGALRHQKQEVAAQLLGSVLTDHGGGWRTPRQAVTFVDQGSLLCGLGLLQQDYPEASRGLAAQIMERH